MEDGRTEEIVRLLARHQDELFRHIFALLPHEEDARDRQGIGNVHLRWKCTRYHATTDVGCWMLDVGCWRIGEPAIQELGPRRAGLHHGVGEDVAVGIATIG